MGYPPVVVVESGGVPRTQVAEGVSAPAFTVVESGARPITLADNAPAIALFNEDGTPYTGGGVPNRTLDLGGSELVTNGQFASDIAGWTDGSAAGGAISWSAGALRTVNTSGTARARQPVTVEVGQRYAFAAQNVGTPSTAGSVSLGTSAGGSQYTVAGGATNPAVAQRVGISEFTASTTTAHIQMAGGVAGTLDWDHATMRKLMATEYPAGTVFEDNFTGDGSILGRLTEDGLPWRIITTTNGAQVVASTSGGSLVVTPNASGATASYPYLDLGDGKATGIHCDLAWTGAGAMAMVSVAKTGARLTIANIVSNSLHIVFTDTQVNVTKYVSGNETTENISYAAAVATDGTVYPGVGWTLNGSTITLTMPDGTTAQRTDADFAAVAGECAVVEHYYASPPTGGISTSKVEIRLG